MERQEVDYTTWRKGRKVRAWTYFDKASKTNKVACTVIDVCPKCGRKGEKNGLVQGAFSFTHKGYLDEVIPGFPLFHVTDHCTIPAPKPEGGTS